MNNNQPEDSSDITKKVFSLRMDKVMFMELQGVSINKNSSVNSEICKAVSEYLDRQNVTLSDITESTERKSLSRKSLSRKSLSLKALKQLYILITNTWSLNKKLINHDRSFDKPGFRKDVMKYTKKLLDYGMEPSEIVVAITNYGRAMEDGTFCYKWSLPEFLCRETGAKKFQYGQCFFEDRKSGFDRGAVEEESYVPDFEG